MAGAGAREPPDAFRTLDARGWEPPEPLVRVLEALDALPRGARLVVLLDLEPRPLFRILKLQGYDYRCGPHPDGHFEVAIWRAAGTSAPPDRPA
jgi:uncharacterized protein (DUF2249 family)